MPAKTKSTFSSTRKAAKESNQQEKIETIEAILLTSKDDTWTFWRPTEEQMDQIGHGDDDDDDPTVSVETLNELEKQLSHIYDIVPQALQIGFSNSFANSNPVLAKEVWKAFGDRYETLRLQHGVAHRLLQLRYPNLYSIADTNGFLKSIEWEQMRQRLSQAVHTTQDKNWLDKMYDLLHTKIMKQHKDRYRKDEDGDLELNNGEDEFTDEEDEDENEIVITGSKKEITVRTPTSGKVARKRARTRVVVLHRPCSLSCQES